MASNCKRIKPVRWLASAAVLAASCVVGCGGQPLEPWHTARLQTEFTAKDTDEITSLDDYLVASGRPTPASCTWASWISAASAA